MVDHFGRNPEWAAGESVYFLSHIHADHRTGLRRQNPPKDMRAICGSAATLDWLRRHCGPAWRNAGIRWITLRPGAGWQRVATPHVRVDVLAADAHHCPGSLMLAMRFSSGANATYVWSGDFRLMPAEHRAWARACGPRVEWLGIDHSRRTSPTLPTLDESAAEVRQLRHQVRGRPVYVATRYHGIEEVLARTGLRVRVAPDFPDAEWTRKWGGFRSVGSSASSSDIVLTRKYPAGALTIWPSAQWHLCANPNPDLRPVLKGRDWRTQRWRLFHSAHASGAEIRQLIAWLRPRSQLVCSDPIPCVRY